MEFRAIGIVGAGLMGCGIAQVAAAAGIDVILQDVNGAALQQGISNISANLERMVSKGKISEMNAAAIRLRIKGTTESRDLGDNNFLIEAATENFDVKHKIL